MAIQTRLYAKEDRCPVGDRARESVDIPFLVILLLLMTVGLVMLYSASYAQSQYDSAKGQQMFHPRFHNSYSFPK